eukprot:TRINITY_DN844_c0_g1_i3.p1 TRINITY_DN844_c0_g1~~TRINITY_DN844_c0_g1_i3.p1  ORF type:complete len:304 (+),score=67.34 TRINITY_DN844_c0_g1_i3:40-912(+)
MANTDSAVNGVMVGTGEYTTGFVHESASGSDKKKGVIALALFDMRRRGKVDRLLMAGTNGRKFPAIRQHIKQQIEDAYRGLDCRFESFPDDNSVDPAAYKTAFDKSQPGDFAIIFTPDDTHFEIALDAINRGLHVLITKPPVKTLEEHRKLLDAARAKNVIVAVELHKRWDPIYEDARYKIRNMGDFSYFYAFMSQPKYQLDTFKSWAGKSSDISYYLNSHHIDFHLLALKGRARPVRVSATAASGLATAAPYNLVAGTEDCITITAQWQSLTSRSFSDTHLESNGFVCM